MERTGREFRFEGLGSERTFALADLQARAGGNPLAEGRKQYCVWLNNSEAAYLTAC